MLGAGDVALLVVGGARQVSQPASPPAKRVCVEPSKEVVSQPPLAQAAHTSVVGQTCEVVQSVNWRPSRCPGRGLPDAWRSRPEVGEGGQGPSVTVHRKGSVGEGRRLWAGRSRQVSGLLRVRRWKVAQRGQGVLGRRLQEELAAVKYLFCAGLQGPRMKPPAGCAVRTGFQTEGTGLPHGAYLQGV